MAKFISILVVAVPFVAACASAPPPTERMASAESAVRAARELGAERVPTAQLHVKLADEEIQKAKALSKDDENGRADTMLQRASADAELALALAREEGSRSEAVRALKEAHDLKTNPAL
jgi:pyridoxal biosynthesis lyase PdxS